MPLSLLHWCCRVGLSAHVAQSTNKLTSASSGHFGSSLTIDNCPRYSLEELNHKLRSLCSWNIVEEDCSPNEGNDKGSGWTVKWGLVYLRNRMLPPTRRTRRSYPHFWHGLQCSHPDVSQSREAEWNNVDWSGQVRASRATRIDADLFLMTGPETLHLITG